MTRLLTRHALCKLRESRPASTHKSKLLKPSPASFHLPLETILSKHNIEGCCFARLLTVASLSCKLVLHCYQHTEQHGYVHITASPVQDHPGQLSRIRIVLQSLWEQWAFHKYHARKAAYG